jgi:hypothetical protein
MKRCIKCGEMKNETEFHKCPANKKDGLHSYCKECRKVYNRENPKKQPELFPAVNNVTTFLKKCSDSELFYELRRRGFSGKLIVSKEIEL